MMVGERHGFTPSWAMVEEDTRYSLSPSSNEQSQYYLQEALRALQRYLPCASGDENHVAEDHHPDSPVDAFSSDQFRMYEFKVRRCARGRSHDWTECPFAHPGEKARRRDPRRYHYSGTGCPEFRKGGCKKGDFCEYSHGVFECWLHPARYRTQPCKDGINCRRRVCFFAHTPAQLRVLPGNQSPASPPASPPASESPPMSPIINRTLNDVVSSLVNIQLGKVGSYSSSWGLGSPGGSVARSSYLSLPTTPTRAGIWDKACFEEEGEVMQRVESGREIRKLMLEKLSKENSFKRIDPRGDAGSGPDVEWVSDLLN